MTSRSAKQAAWLTGGAEEGGGADATGMGAGESLDNLLTIDDEGLFSYDASAGSADDLIQGGQEPPPAELGKPSDEEEFGGDGFGFAEEDGEVLGFDLSEIETDAVVKRKDQQAAEQSMAPQTDEEAFGDGGFGFDGFDAGEDDTNTVAAEKAAAKHKEEEEGLAGSSDDDERQVVQTNVNGRFPAACQGFRAIDKASQVLVGVTFIGMQMLEPGKLTVEVRDKHDGMGTLLGKVSGIDGTKYSLRKVVKFPEPIVVEPGRPYYLQIKLEGTGLFKFEVGENGVDADTCGIRYRFCVAPKTTADEPRWAATRNNVSYRIKFNYTDAPSTDPERGLMSNWLQHTKTSQSKGTLARRLSIKKRSLPKFFVLEESALDYYNVVDGEKLGTITLADVTRIDGDETGGSTVLVVCVKGADHSINCKTRQQCVAWIKALKAQVRKAKAAAGKEVEL